MIILLAAPAAPAQDYGPLIPDPAGVIDLPAGFSYRIVSHTGDEMTDGLRVPGLPDGMGAFPGPDGTTVVVCNHETFFATDLAWLAQSDTTKIYDRGLKGFPPAGCTTTFVWDHNQQTVVRRYLSLAGTINNCSGGTTPWNTWLTCEESAHGAGWGDDKARLRRDHGYVFEVPASADGGLAPAIPIVAMGRFVHEATAYDPRTGIIYQTEDLHDGLFYRFIPAKEGKLLAGGRLQALALRDGRRESNNRATSRIEVGSELAVKWITMRDVNSPTDSLRYEGFERGACRFDRGEGVIMMNGSAYFTCTTGGPASLGQVWRYQPARREGRALEWREAGALQLVYESENVEQANNPDNICALPDGDLLICEDPENRAPARLLVLSRTGGMFTLGRSRVPGELTGPTFSPDGTTLFVNLQLAGITLAVTGPWETK